jgi:hypothetical protein
MEVDKIVDIEENSDDEKEEEVLHPIEMNAFDQLENESLIVGVYGNGFAFIKSSLLLEIKANKAFKIKYMTRNTEHKQLAKKLICELYQVKEGSTHHLVLLTKNYLQNHFYNEVLDHLTKTLNLKFNSILIADGVYSNK